jgi:periplasmic protein CpxP/Spy
MRNRPFTLADGVVLMLGMTGHSVAQDSGVQQTSARQQLQRTHTPLSIDQELARLTKDLALTPEQQQQVRPLLEEHHDRIQALLDKNPKASRHELGPQIHAISDETHRKIHGVASVQIFLNSRQGGKTWRPHIAGVDERKEVQNSRFLFGNKLLFYRLFLLFPFCNKSKFSINAFKGHAKMHTMGPMLSD